MVGNTETGTGRRLPKFRVTDIGRENPSERRGTQDRGRAYCDVRSSPSPQSSGRAAKPAFLGSLCNFRLVVSVLTCEVANERQKRFVLRTASTLQHNSEAGLR